MRQTDFTDLSHSSTQQCSAGLSTQHSACRQHTVRGWGRVGSSTTFQDHSAPQGSATENSLGTILALPQTVSSDSELRGAVRGGVARPYLWILLWCPARTLSHLALNTQIQRTWLVRTNNWTLDTVITVRSQW